MLKVQEYLTNKMLEELISEYGINAITNNENTLLKLNYDQIDSKGHKYHPIVAECRGLVLEKSTYKYVANGFHRFFNIGEQTELDKTFDWEKATVDEKCDGSMIMLYWYNGKWHVNTRGSFGQGKISSLLDDTWESLFLSTINTDSLEGLDKTNTYVLELMSTLNKVVVHHEKTHSKLLGVFDNLDSGREILDQNYLNTIAEILGVERPKRFDLLDLPSLLNYINSQPYHFEGVVAFDGKTRLKIKNPLYVAVHHIKGNEPSPSKKNIIPFIVKGEGDELKIYFPELKSVIEGYEHAYKCAQIEVADLWNKYCAADSQKEFALGVKDSKFSGVLFTARKTKESPIDILRKSEDLLINKL